MKLPVIDVITKWSAPVRQYMQARDSAVMLSLANSVRPRVMVEFGVNVGFTAEMFLKNIETIERYVGVDVPKSYQTELPEQWVEVPDSPGCRVIGIDKRFELIMRPRGTLDLKPDDLPRADVVFIDGDHGRGAVEHDSRLAAEIINPGGVIMWHDYGNHVVEVNDVLDKLLDEGWNLAAVSGSWIAFEQFE